MAVKPTANMNKKKALGREGDLPSLSLDFPVQNRLLHHPQVLQDSTNYGGGLNGVAHIQEAVLLKQMESLQKLLLSMNNTIWVCAAELDRVCALAGKFLGSPISLIFMKLFPDIHNTRLWLDFNGGGHGP